MNFILTQFIYPLETEITLSSSLGIKLDNAKSPNEIETIKNYLKVSLDSPNKMYEYFHEHRLPKSAPNGIGSLRGAVRDLKKKYKNVDPYIHRFFIENKGKDIFDVLARIWVVARYDDEGSINALQLEQQKIYEEEGKGYFVMLNDDHPIVKNSSILVSFTYLLSLLINTEEGYYGRSFILHHDEATIRSPKIDRWLNLTLVYWTMFVYPALNEESENRDESRWRHFPIIKDKLIHTANLVEKIFAGQEKDKFIYIASLLKSAGHEIKDDRFKLITLVSIMELILTRNPETSRFNVEDSISRQFKLKAGILIYLNDKTRSLESIKKRLAEIYNQRSNIAHGNFKTFQDWLNKEKKQIDEDHDPSDKYVLETMTIDTYGFLKAIIEEYLKDGQLVEFIKNN